MLSHENDISLTLTILKFPEEDESSVQVFVHPLLLVLCDELKFPSHAERCF